MQTLAPCPQEASPDYSPIAYRLASSSAELEQAFELVYDAYVRVGLEKTGAQGIRLTKYHLLPDTKVFVALSNDENGKRNVIGTVSVVSDGVLGLPAEQIARQEISSLRRIGERPAEFVALASNEEGTQQRVFLNLFRLGFEYCRLNGYSTIIAALTSRHIGFYRRFLGFEPLGQLKPYGLANGTPVQAHCINLVEASELVANRGEVLEREHAGRVFWQDEADKALAAARPARPWDSQLVERFVGRSQDLVDQLDPPTVEALANEYNRYGWQFPANSVPQA